MNLNAIHVILTYRCTSRCKHCFHFGSPKNNQVFTSSQLRRYIKQITDVPSIRWVFFEGGEPTLYFPLLMQSLKVADRAGLATAVTTNGYWITSVRDMVPWLKHFREANLNLLQISCDELHGNTRLEHLQRDIVDAASKAGIQCQFVGVSVPPYNDEPVEARRGEMITSGPIVFRGRAVHKLAEPQATWLWSSFDECPHESLDDPYRLHVDPYGELLACQGISLGNLERRTLPEILEAFDPQAHPIIGPLVRGGPAGLATEHEVAHAKGYVDACHLCYGMRRTLRERFPELLAPAIHYGPGSGRGRGKRAGRGRGGAKANKRRAGGRRHGAGGPAEGRKQLDGQGRSINREADDAQPE
jgi:pyruvate-formate lyase-activating enzyme